jgi:DNA (cytosine-5)-methyltransferase 1
MIDLFAGAGGLTLGLESAGFSSVLAVEHSPMAAETYFRNFVRDDLDEWRAHLRRRLVDQVGAGIAVRPTAEVLDEFAAVEKATGSQPGDLDLLAGGPPCQGFSLAGLRNPADVRNRLPYEFLEFVRRLAPKLVLIENVAGIGASFSRMPGQSPLEQLRDALELTGPGYVSQILEVNARHFGVAQHRPRIMIVGLRIDVAGAFGRDTGTGDLQGLLATARWSSNNLELAPPLLAPARVMGGSPPSVADILGDLTSTGYRFHRREEYDGLEAAAALRFSDVLRPRTKLNGLMTAMPPNHTLRAHAPRTALRFKLHLALARYGVPPDIFQTGIRHQHDLKAAMKSVEGTLDEHEVSLPLTMPDGSRILDTATGEDLGQRRALSYAILELATRKHSQRALKAHQPSPTVMSLPDDFVHYAEPRTLTVREMARIQSFPDSFIFHSKETTGSHRRRVEVPQYTQVGNAVPPLLARAVGRHLMRVLNRAERVTSDDQDAATAVAASA